MELFLIVVFLVETIMGLIFSMAPELIREYVLRGFLKSTGNDEELALAIRKASSFCLMGAAIGFLCLVAVRWIPDQ